MPITTTPPSTSDTFRWRVWIRGGRLDDRGRDSGQRQSGSILAVHDKTHLLDWFSIRRFLLVANLNDFYQIA